MTQVINSCKNFEGGRKIIICQLLGSIEFVVREIFLERLKNTALIFYIDNSQMIIGRQSLRSNLQLKKCYNKRRLGA